MLFSSSFKNVSDELHVHSFDGSPIKHVPAYKYLGIWIDMNLTFKKQIDELVNKELGFKVSFFYRNRSRLSLSCRKQIIQSTFLSVPDNCDTIYQSAATTTLKPLDAIYHSALRFVTGDSFYNHCILCRKVGWISLKTHRLLSHRLGPIS